MKKYSLFLAFVAFLFFSLQPLQGQNNQINWEDDDEEEVVEDDSEAWDIGAGKFADVLIRLNGKDTQIEEELEFTRKDTLSIQIRHMKPASAVVLHMKKAGIKVKRTSYYANEKGQLDLEIKTGNRKVSGSAVIYYTPSNGKRIERKVKIKVK